MSPPKYVDLVVIAAALAVFLLGGLPMLGFAAGAGVWLVQRGIQMFAERLANKELAAGNRQRAMATAVLVVGLAVEREAGLAAALLVLVLFTISFAAQGIAHLLEPEGEKAA